MWSFFSRDPTSSFPYEFGEEIKGLEEKSVWTLHEGKRKSNGEAVSIFTIDLKTSRSEHIETAKAAHKRIKTLRHPNFLTYVDGLETENVIYVVTEPATTLQAYLDKEQSSDAVISWGLHQVVKGLSFLHNDCKLKHNNVNISSIFVNPAGEWKLGGVDYITPVDSEATPHVSKLLPSLDKYDPPEKSDTSKRRKVHAWSADMWGLGCLIWEVYNGNLPRVSSLKAIGKIPKPLIPHYCELVGANPMSRPNPAKFIDNCKSAGGFMNNKFLESNLFLEEIQIKDQSDKTKFLQGLSSSLDDFPQVFCQLKILPLLLQAFEFGNAGSAILTPLLKLGKLLDTEEYEKKIVPCVVKMFSSTDRATRVKLLQQIDQFVEYLSASVVNDQIFPNICHGFNDTNPLIRETSVKAMLLLASKLNDKNLNIELLRHFARLQAKDDQTRQKVLSSAFVRAMKDPFPPARGAGVLSMMSTLKYFSLRDTAFKVLPTLCTLTVDPDKGVRDQTFKAIQTFLVRQQNVSDNPELAAEIDHDMRKNERERGNNSSTEAKAVSEDGKEKLTPGTDEREEVARDSASDYDNDDEEGEKPGWDDLEMREDAETNADDEGWGEETGWEEDGWSDLQTKKPTVPASKGSLKLGTKKKEPEFNLDDWADDSWGSQDKQLNKKQSTKTATKSSHKKQQASSGWGTDWEEGNWGEMKDQGDVQDPFAAEAGGGWDDDNEDWGSIDEPTLNTTKPSSPKKKQQMSSLSGFGNDFKEDNEHTPASAYNWNTEKDTGDTFFGSQLGVQSKPKSSSKPSKPPSSRPASAKTKPKPSMTSSEADTGWGFDEEWGKEEETGWERVTLGSR
ncbi:putative N-terminal kinase-like protein [Apostichopus japonicus]|uniref:N-terminal kinase-like protein n=1 Tax=Stichopus japonicus TaxID=307972 RepID=A0A2G8LML0_STIJA|nr:putative N-terminal kinase-like protein [Apostichopus japonicus]